MNTYKLVLVGDGGTGKTSLLNKHLTGEFERRYVATLGVDVHSLVFHTNQGTPIRFNVWDTAGQEKFSGLKDSYYAKADCGMVFFDLTSRITFKNVLPWLNSLKKHTPNLILVATKSDCSDQKPLGLDIVKLCTELDIHCHVISVKNDSVSDLQAPFLDLARKVTQNPQLDFIIRDEEEE